MHGLEQVIVQVYVLVERGNYCDRFGFTLSCGVSVTLRAFITSAYHIIHLKKEATMNGKEIETQTIHEDAKPKHETL